MRNTITLNGIESNEIAGLLIQSLPPISKPLMRTEIEEIDGRDGDIVTPLGFSAYNKEINIGLYGDFDIDEVIQYFTSSGTVIFSNEPEKYYNYQIIEQIDFERLLRYRTATVTMHVQPFKYSTEENAKIGAPTKNLLNAMDAAYGLNSQGQSVEDSLTLVKSVGQLQITIDEDIATNVFAAQVTVTGLTVGTTYTLSANASAGATTVYLYTDSLWGTRVAMGNLNDGITFEATTTSVVVGFYSTNNTAGSTRTIKNIQLEEGSTATAYVPCDAVYITNSGNYFSRPQITITGSGMINLYLNGNQLFVIDMGETSTNITIDTAAMEAYQGTPEVLMNRSVDGDYSNFKLNVGKNTISWSGNLTQIVINNYSRWI